MVLKKVIGSIFGVLLAVCAWAQQDAQYSQYMFNQLAINPAFAGSREVFSSALVYRNQWTGIQGAPTTAAASAQMPLKQKKIGIGAEVYSDRLGPKAANAILFSYAYRLRLGKGKLAFGLRMGMMNYVYDWSKMDYKDQSDVYNTQARSSKLTGTGDFGLYYYTRTFYCGLSGTHLNRGNTTEFDTDSSRQARHFFFTLGKSFEVGATVINPVLAIKTAGNAPATTDLGVNILLRERLWVGMSFRSAYGIVLLTQYQINEKFKCGYSYDMGTNRIGRAGGGSHEIMIGYDINILGGTKIPNPRYL